MSKRITYYEYEKSVIKIFMNFTNEYNNDEYNNDELKKCRNIVNLYKKQNRFNPYTFIYRMYKSYLPYGKTCIIIDKLQFTILFLLLGLIPFIAFFKIIAYVVLFFIPVILIFMFLSQKYGKKYKKVKEEYNYQKKYNPNFERKQKLKRILN